MKKESKALSDEERLILRIVVGSSATITVIHGQASGTTVAICAACFVVGAVASFLLAKLDKKNPHEAII